MINDSLSKIDILQAWRTSHSFYRYLQFSSVYRVSLLYGMPPDTVVGFPSQVLLPLTLQVKSITSYDNTHILVLTDITNFGNLHSEIT